MINTDKKLDELQQWSDQPNRPPLPTYLLPNHDDMQALVYRETIAMLYPCEVFSVLFEEVEQLRKVVATLQKQVEGKPS